MNKNNWNKTLKFSWGHIMAFMALIFIGYIAYLGDFFMLGEDYINPGIKSLISLVIIEITGHSNPDQTRVMTRLCSRVYV